jgi:hypothetical protein
MTQAEITEQLKRFIDFLGKHEYLTWGIVLAIFIGFMLLGSRTSGWHKVAAQYPCTNQYKGAWISQPDFFERDSGRVVVDFNNNESDGAIKLGADNNGLYMVMSNLFRLFHPPIFVPWQDVKCEWVGNAPWLKEKTTLRITFDGFPNIPLEVNRHIVGEMERLAQGQWTAPKAGPAPKGLFQ